MIKGKFSLVKSYNPDFRIRIRFDTVDGIRSSGDRVTFNNISLDCNLRPFVPQSVDVFLGHNYPNPFNSVTTIPFTLAESGRVRLEVFNTLGQRVAVLLDEELEAGNHQAIFDRRNLASGVYHYRLQTDRYILTRMMVLIR